MVTDKLHEALRIAHNYKGIYAKGTIYPPQWKEVIKISEALIELNQESVKCLELIQAKCGIPDASEACRQIIKYCNEIKEILK